MKIQAGKRYVTRNGIVTSPIKPSKNGTNYIWKAEINEPDSESGPISIQYWLENGEAVCPGYDYEDDLVAEFEE